MMTALPLSGWLAANLGRKRAFMAALGLFTLASFVCASSTSLVALSVARFFQGLGAGAMTPLASAALMDAYPEEELPTAFKIIGLGGMIGPLTGPLLGGWILDNFPWPTMFLINVPVGCAALSLASSVLRDQSESTPKSSFDWGALATMTAGLVAFQYVVQQGPRDEWFASGNVVLGTLVAIVALTIFARNQFRATTPLVDLKPLLTPSFSVGTLLAIVTGIGLTGTAFIVPLYFEQVLGFDSTTAGLGMLPAAIATFAAIQFASSSWASRLSPVVVALAGLLCCAVGTLWFCLLGKNVGFSEIILPRVVQGIGNGLTYVPLNVLVMRGLPRALYDAASGLTGLARQLGVSLGYAALSAYLVRAQTAAGSELAARVRPSAFTDVLGLGPIRDFLVAHGWSAAAASTQARSVFAQLLARDAALWGYDQTFFAIGLLFLASVPAVAMFWRTATSGGDR
jgi:DHA2 family multidrug resistance protein